MSRPGLWIGSGLLLVIATIVAAQPPGGPRGGGFGRPGFGPPGGNSLSGMMAMPEVRKELGITQEQAKPLDELQASLQEKTQAEFQGFDPRSFQDLTPEERDDQFAKMRAKVDEINKQSDAKLSELIKPEQLRRLRQLQLQRESLGALSRPDVARRLAVTAEQAERIEAIREKGGFAFGPPRPNPEGLAEAVALLDAAQQAAWKELTGEPFTFPPQGFGPPGFGPPGGEERKLVKEFDANGDGWLNNVERQAARSKAKESARGPGRGPGGPGGPGRGPGGPGGFGPGGRNEEGKPGPRVSPADVTPVTDAPLYDPKVVRTLFLEFENEDWEAEIADFHGTDVEVPATLTVDGKQYPQVGVHFRGMSSYGMVRAGSKRSLNVSLGLVDREQRLYGYKTLNLLNSHGDPSFLHTVLYSHIARQHIPAPQANLVKVVINGESWGVYVNAQQFDKLFVEESFHGKAARWKVRGSPGGDAGLKYTGEKVEDYKRRYEIKSEDKDASWQALIKLCKTLNETPADQLEEALRPMLDIDGALWFLALDNALINSDGYWIRASDYAICLDDQRKFHFVPHDMNETFAPAMGPGAGGPGGPGGRGPGGRGLGERGSGGPGRGPGGGGGYTLDPLVGLDDASKPLRSKLLAVPKLREQYLRNIRTIAQESLDWEKLGPTVAQYQSLIEKEIEADTRKLTSFTAFQQAVAKQEGSPEARGPNRSLHAFAEQRRKFLLQHPEIKKLGQGE